MLALETAIVVSYARAFTKSSLVQLDRDAYRPTWPEQPYCHDELLKLRDSRYAHTDLTPAVTLSSARLRKNRGTQ
jgi:hypothetical protein